jgi:DNA-binding MarR family transcriptional regulator
MARLENLFGAQALAVADRLVTGARPRSEAGALVTLLAHPGRSTGWLGGVLGLTSGGITRLVDRLVTDGWVQRSPGNDARRRTLALTASGAEQAEQILADRRAAIDRALCRLDADERRTLERLLDKVLAALPEDSMEALQLCRLCDRHACADGDPARCPLQSTTTTVSDD